MGLIIFSILMIIGGGLCVAYGDHLNNNVEAQLESFFSSGETNPGDTWVSMGVIVIIIGVILLIVGIVSLSGNSNHSSYSSSNYSNSSYSNSYGGGYNQSRGLSYQQSKEMNDNRLLNNNGWKCICGVVNPNYTGTCGCGRTREQAKNKENEVKEEKKIAMQTRIAEQEIKKKVESEKVQQDKLVTYNLRLDNIKKMKELLDAGAITQEEFNEKKKQLLDDM